MEFVFNSDSPLAIFINSYLLINALFSIFSIAWVAAQLSCAGSLTEFIESITWKNILITLFFLPGFISALLISTGVICIWTIVTFFENSKIGKSINEFFEKNPFRK